MHVMCLLILSCLAVKVGFLSLNITCSLGLGVDDYGDY